MKILFGDFSFHFLFGLQVLAERSPGLLDFHLDLVSLEAATKVMIYSGPFLPTNK